MASAPFQPPIDAATSGGADALGRPDLGRLAPGCKADVTVIDFTHTLQTPDPIQSLMTSASGRDIRAVFIDGRLVMHDRQLPDYHDSAMFRQAQQQFDGLVTRYPERTLGHPPLTEIFSSSYPRKNRLT